jgi:hypothetical protein
MKLAISIAVSVAVLVVLLAIVEIARRRGIDAVGYLARPFDPASPATPPAQPPAAAITTGTSAS